MVAADRRARAVPRVLVWDGEGAVGRWRGRRPELTGHCQAFRGVLGVKVLICKPGDPEAKGLVERFHDYLETSFLPGRAFTGPDDFNSQLSGWLAAAEQSRVPPYLGRTDGFVVGLGDDERPPVRARGLKPRLPNQSADHGLVPTVARRMRSTTTLSCDAALIRADVPDRADRGRTSRPGPVVDARTLPIAKR
jgi:hypothetical protein